MSTPPDPFATPSGTPPAGPPQGYGPPPGQQQWSGYGPPQQGPAGPQQTETKAIVALVLAVASFVTVPVVLAIVALFLARSSEREIAASGGRLTGEGLAKAARITAWIHLGLCLAGVVLFVLLFGFLAATGFS
jgi:hypothetical protein